MELTQKAKTALVQIQRQNPWQLFWANEPLIISDEANQQFAIIHFNTQENQKNLQIVYSDFGLRSEAVQQYTGFEVWEPNALYEDWLELTYTNNGELKLHHQFQGKPIMTILQPEFEALNRVLPALTSLLANMPSLAKINSQLTKERYPVWVYQDNSWQTKFKVFRLPKRINATVDLKPFRQLRSSQPFEVSLEVAVTFLDSQVTDKIGKAFYPQMLIVADHSTGQILTQDVIPQNVSTELALSRWLIRFIEQNGRPFRIYTHYLEAQSLKEVARALKINLTYEIPLRYIGALYQALSAELKMRPAE